MHSHDFTRSYTRTHIMYIHIMYTHIHIHVRTLLHMALHVHIRTIFEANLSLASICTYHMLIVVMYM